MKLKKKKKKKVKNNNLWASNFWSAMEIKCPHYEDHQCPTAKLECSDCCRIWIHLKNLQSKKFFNTIRLSFNFMKQRLIIQTICKFQWKCYFNSKSTILIGHLLVIIYMPLNLYTNMNNYVMREFFAPREETTSNQEMNFQNEFPITK